MNNKISKLKNEKIDVSRETYKFFLINYFPGNIFFTNSLEIRLGNISQVKK